MTTSVLMFSLVFNPDPSQLSLWSNIAIIFAYNIFRCPINHCHPSNNLSLKLYLFDRGAHLVSHMTQNGKYGNSDPERSDAVDDDDGQSIVQALFVVGVEAGKSHHHALATGEGEEYLLAGIRPYVQLQQLFKLRQEINEDTSRERERDR